MTLKEIAEALEEIERREHAYERKADIVRDIARLRLEVEITIRRADDQPGIQ